MTIISFKFSTKRRKGILIRKITGDDDRTDSASAALLYNYIKLFAGCAKQKHNTLYKSILISWVINFYERLQAIIANSICIYPRVSYRYSTLLLVPRKQQSAFDYIH